MAESLYRISTALVPQLYPGPGTGTQAKAASEIEMAGPGATAIG
jgi:hypothetical protein